MGKAKVGKSSKGCFFWGGITVVAIVLVAIGGILLGGYRQINQFVEALDDQPAPIEVAAYTNQPPEVIRQATSSYNKLRDAIANGSPVSVAFTADQLNTLIANHDDLEELRGHVQFDIVGDALQAQVSYPADVLDPQLPDMFEVKGKYFNGTFLLQPSLERGRLQFRILDASMKGESIAPSNLRVLQQNDLRKSIEWGLSEGQLNDLRRFESALDEVTVRDNKLLIRTRDTAPADNPDQPAQ